MSLKPGVNLMTSNVTSADWAESGQIIHDALVEPITAFAVGVLVIRVGFPLITRFIRRATDYGSVHPRPWQQMRLTLAVRVPYRTDDRSFTRKHWKMAYAILRKQAHSGNDVAVYWLKHIRGFV